MSELYLLTNAAEPPSEIMPALGLLLHTVRTGPADMIAFEDAAAADVILVDARHDLMSARQLCQLLRRAGPQAPVLAVMTEGGLAARLRGRVLDLTFKEFELLKFLAQHPGRVFTRAHLLQEVWGYDYFGGTRTVDVHVRRLRAKLGAEHESLIGTVRNVGYRFVPLKTGEDNRRSAARAAGPTATEPRAAAGQSPTTEPPAGTGRSDTTEPDAGDEQFDDGKAGGLVPGNVRGG